MTQGYRQYSKVYQKAAVSTVDQRKLIILLYDGAIKFLSIAANKLEAGNTYEAHTNLIRGKSIVAELLGSLDMNNGGEIAENLQRLYAYMFNQLIDANVSKDAARISHVVSLLKDLREAWKEIPSGQGKAAAASAAPEAPGAEQSKKINLRG